MFELLARVLVWILIGRIFWYILVKFIPKDYLAWLGGLLVFLLIALAFFDPTNSPIDIIWQLISLPLKPLGLVLVLLFLSLGAETKKFEWNMLWPTRLAAERLVTAFLVLALASNPLFSYYFARHAERSLERSIDFQIEICQGACPVVIGRTTSDPVTAIVVLGPSTRQFNPVPATRQPVATAGFPLEILMFPGLASAAQVYNEQAALGNRPIVYVAEGPTRNEESQTAEITNALLTVGVPASQVVVDSSAFDIRSAAEEVAGDLRDRGVDLPNARIAVLTPALNLSRASLTFANLGMRVRAVPTSFFASNVNQDSRDIEIGDLVPSADALLVTTRVWDEHLTSIYYFLRGWLPDFDVTWKGNVRL